MTNPSLRVLIIDSEREFGENLSAMLRLAGHQALHVSEVVAGWVILRAMAFDVVITDLDTIGVEKLCAITVDMPSVALVGMSANADGATRAKAEKLGIRDFLLKPIASSVLNDLIQLHWQVQRLRRVSDQSMN
ncbi:MAG: response regulator [Kofleriaceae bacterium]